MCYVYMFCSSNSVINILEEGKQSVLRAFLLHLVMNDPTSPVVYHLPIYKLSVYSIRPLVSLSTSTHPSIERRGLLHRLLEARKCARIAT